MDRAPEEFQVVGIFGIYREAFKTIISRKKLFMQITLTLILPISLLTFSHFHLSELLFGKIQYGYDSLSSTQSSNTAQRKIVVDLTFKWVILGLINAGYFLLFFTFSLISAYAVVYAIACIYAAKELSFKNILSAVPRICRRVIDPCLYKMIAYQMCNLFFLALCPICGQNVLHIPMIVGMLVLLLLSTVCLISFASLYFDWHFCCVVSTFEGLYGRQAWDKSFTLFRDQTGVNLAILGVNQVGVIMTDLGYYMLVVHGTSLGIVSKVICGIIFFLLLSKIILLGLVVQTVVYFVCKSRHHERIEKIFLANHLEVFLNRVCPAEEGNIELN